MSVVKIDVALGLEKISEGLQAVKGQFGGLGSTLTHMGKTIAAGFWAPFDAATVKVMSKAAELANSKFNAALASDNQQGIDLWALEHENILNKLSAARERLALASQASSQKQAASEEQTSSRIKTAFQTAFSHVKTIASGIGTAFQTAFSKVKSAVASFKSAFTKAFSGLRSAVQGVSKVVSNIKSKFSLLGKSAGSFGSRFKSIVSGMLVFNAISTVLRKTIDYFRTAIMASDGMKDAMANLRGAAASAAAPLIQMLTPALTKFINAVAAALAYIGQFTTLLTGKIGKVATTAEKGTKKAAGAAKKASKSLAGFDEITKLNDKESSGGGGGAGGAKTPATKMPDVSLPDWAKQIADMLKNGKWAEAAKVLTDKLNELVDSVDWEKVGKKIAYWLNGALTFLATAILTFDWHKLGSSLATSINQIINNVDWSNLGVVLGAKFIALIGLLGGFFAKLDWKGLGSAISSSLMGLWNAIDWAQAAKMISDGLIGLFTSISTAIKNIDWYKIGNDILLFLQTIDWNGIVIAIADGLGAAIGGLGALIWGLIEDAWKDVVKWWKDTAYKDGEFTIEGLLEGIGKVCKNIGKWIHDNIFKPFIKGIEDAFKIQSPSKVMEEEGDFIIAGLLNGITNAWKSITKFFEDAVGWVKNKFAQLKKEAINTWESVKQTWTVVGGWFKDNIINPVTEAFSNMWTKLKNWATDAWNGIKEVFKPVADWFGEKFGNAWEKVKKVFSSGGKVFDGIKDGIVTTFKSIVNKLISGINRVVKTPFDGLNNAIKKIKNVEVLGMKPFNGLSTVSVPSIPYLAKGAVLPANKPFMAVVGDQRHGTNVEAPLTTIQEAVAAVMGDQVSAMMAGFNALLEENQRLRQVVENVNLGDSTIGQAAERYQNSVAVMWG